VLRGNYVTFVTIQVTLSIAASIAESRQLRWAPGAITLPFECEYPVHVLNGPSVFPGQLADVIAGESLMASRYSLPNWSSLLPRQT
jgi:hypothetical protein